MKRLLLALCLALTLAVSAVFTSACWPDMTCAEIEYAIDQTNDTMMDAIENGMANQPEWAETMRQLNELGDGLQAAWQRNCQTQGG